MDPLRATSAGAADGEVGAGAVGGSTTDDEERGEDFGSFPDPAAVVVPPSSVPRRGASASAANSGAGGSSGSLGRRRSRGTARRARSPLSSEQASALLPSAAAYGSPKKKRGLSESSDPGCGAGDLCHRKVLERLGAVWPCSVLWAPERTGEKTKETPRVIAV